MGEDVQQRRLALAGGLIVAGLAILLRIALALKRRVKASSGKAQLLPGGPPAWPIVGHLPLLMKGLPHQVLGNLYLKEGYGPIVGLRLGSQRVIVVSSPAFAKELLLTHDKLFANRVRLALTDHLCYGFNKGVAFTTYNARWVWMRRFVTQELLSANRLQKLAHVRYDEMRKLMRSLHQASQGGTRAVDVGEAVGYMTADTTARLVHSTTLGEAATDLPEIVRRCVEVSRPTLGDFFPFLGFLDVLPKRRMRLVHDRLDKIFDSIIKERRRLMAREPPKELPNDFLQAMLSTGNSNTVEEEDDMTDRDAKALMMDIYGASMHSTKATTEWALAELLRNPECLQRLRQEVDDVTRRTVEEGGSDHATARGLRMDVVTVEVVQKMPFLECVVKEALRLHSAAPLLPSRISSADCKMDKYFVAKGTQAIVNMWAIARDPAIWEKPECFWPDRFEASSKMSFDAGGQHYEFLPFGSGRRMCPGMRLGLSTVQVILANFVKFFDWELPHGVSPSTIDMSEQFGVACNKKFPMMAIPKLRHSLPP
ncbi:hypothetical protein GOP47_0016643 [Adiantum capillus-veneris]|uniref:Cytochrome P450 n=2 Tax=Adiantum capillus-veneris TaxID=13818 RepID=A0A9D4UIZ0_ADICA|nr:hypothetical protein GOP47_0016643 [Adiantum capillus-veneris]